MLVLLGFRKLRSIVNNRQYTNIMYQPGKQGMFWIEFSQFLGKHMCNRCNTCTMIPEFFHSTVKQFGRSLEQLFHRKGHYQLMGNIGAKSNHRAGTTVNLATTAIHGAVGSLDQFGRDGRICLYNFSDMVNIFGFIFKRFTDTYCNIR